METIRIHNMVFYGYHGVKSEESSLGARFEVDVSLSADLSTAIRSDALKDTINYNDVYDVVEQLVTEKKYYLIEALAGRIADAILEQFPMITIATASVRKPNAPIKGVLDHVEVEVERIREIPDD